RRPCRCRRRGRRCPAGPRGSRPRYRLRAPAGLRPSAEGTTRRRPRRVPPPHRSPQPRWSRATRWSPPSLLSPLSRLGRPRRRSRGGLLRSLLTRGFITWALILRRWAIRSGGRAVGRGAVRHGTVPGGPGAACATLALALGLPLGLLARGRRRGRRLVGHL